MKRGMYPPRALKLKTYLHLVPRLRMNGTITPLLHVPTYCVHGQVYLHHYHEITDRVFLYRLLALVNVVMNLRVPQNEGNFLTSWEPASFSNRNPLHGVSKFCSYGKCMWNGMSNVWGFVLIKFIIMKITVRWSVTPYNLVKIYWRFK